MRTCGTVFTKGQCDGHFGGKFDDCVAEALYVLSLDSSEDDRTGSCDFEGHLCLFVMDQTEGVDMEGDGEHLVLVPAGNYILFTGTTGGVSLWEYGTKDEALAEFDVWRDRYEMWDSQDDY